MHNVMETDAAFRAFTLILRECNAVVLLFMNMPLSSSLIQNVINCRKLSKVSNNLYISRKNNSFYQPSKAKDFRQLANIQKGIVIMVAVDALNKFV